MRITSGRPLPRRDFLEQAGVGALTGWLALNLGACTGENGGREVDPARADAVNGPDSGPFRISLAEWSLHRRCSTAG